MGRILVIEDEPGTQLLLQSRLKDLGHDVVVKSTGAQGIAEARSSSFDLNLVDMHLGEGVDGIEVCRRLKRDPETRNVPVVMISGRISGRADLHRGYEAGCESFLNKNDMSLVEDVIRAMLRIKSLGDELSAQMALLQQRNEHLQEALQDKAELEDALARTSEAATATGGGRLIPDGIVLVDSEGTVAYADRGAREIFAKRIEGRSLGSLAPGTRLEAFVRDARTARHQGFRFTVSARGSRPRQDVVASVLPLVPNVLGAERELTVVLLFEERRQQATWDRIAAAEQGVELVEAAALVEHARREYQPARVLGSSAAITAIRERLAELADATTPVVLRGEPGAGKRFLAHVLHFASERTGAFVPVACAALGRERIARELFGEDGRPGLLLRAQAGTLFLEDAEAIPGEVRTRLAGTLASRTLDVEGERKPRDLDVRIVVSTSSDEDDSLAGELLGDQSVESIELPSLRRRGEDVGPLARAFLDRYGAAPGRLDLTDEAWSVLENHDWPGNVGELEACLAAACRAAGPSARVVDVEHLPAPLPDVHRRLLERGQVTPRQRPAVAIPGTHLPHASIGGHDGDSTVLDEVFDVMPEVEDDGIPVSFEFFEKWALSLALSRSAGDKLRAARMLNVGKSTLYRKLHKYEIR
jgi:DNA-binding NtrC family response regulator